MRETEYEVVLKWSMSRWNRLQRALERSMEKRAEDGDDIIAEALMYGELDNRLKQFEMAEEQKRLQDQIKDLETRRNALQS